MGPWDSLIIDFLTGNQEISPLEQKLTSSVPHSEITHLTLVVLGTEALKDVNVTFALSFTLVCKYETQSPRNKQTRAKVRINWAHVSDNSCFDYEKGQREKRKVEEGPGGAKELQRLICR